MYYNAVIQRSYMYSILCSTVGVTYFTCTSEVGVVGIYNVHVHVL